MMSIERRDPAVERWDPFREMISLRDAMDRLLEESVVWPNMPLGSGLGPALDLRESDDAYTVRAALPGFRPEEIAVDLVDDTLTIRAERRREEEREERDYVIREHSMGAVSRTIALPGPVEAEQIRSRHEHGELVLTLPKAGPSRRWRIPIGGGRPHLAGGAHRYGYEAGRSERYRGRGFDEAEAELRGEYEGRERAAGRGIGGLWARLRDEIRAGWDRARGKQRVAPPAAADGHARSGA